VFTKIINHTSHISEATIKGTFGTSLASEKMGDRSTEAFELQEIGDPEEYSFHQLLGDGELHLDEDIIPSIVNHIDCFVSQSRGNMSVENVVLYPYSVNGRDEDLWEKVGQAVGNLQSLEILRISTRNYDSGNYDSGNYDSDNYDSDNYDSDNYDSEVEDSEVEPIWEILASILKYVRRRIELSFFDEVSWDAEESRLMARAIQGHPSICSFQGNSGVSYESMDTLLSVLATLPSLESITLSNRALEVRPENVSTLANADSLTKLLRVPTLRSVDLEDFSFTPALFQATANALMGGTAITKLVFTACSVAIEASTEMMIKGFCRNTSVTCIDIMSPCDGTLCNVITAALPSNSTLRRLHLREINRDNDPNLYSRVFSALGQNTELRTLIVDEWCAMDESLCTVMRNGLEMNETLESLELKYVPL
jgi:hypothetical protein